MFNKLAMSADDIMKVALAAQAKAEQRLWKVSIAIADEGGNPVFLKRLDGAAPISAYIAHAKAHSAALGQRETKDYENMINQGRFAFISAPKLDGMLEGGIPILVEGQCVGAIGISGVRPSEDAEVALAGAAALL